MFYDTKRIQAHCTAPYAVRQFLLIGRHEHSLLTAREHSSWSIAKYIHGHTIAYTQAHKRRVYRSRRCGVRHYRNLQFVIILFSVIVVVISLYRNTVVPNTKKMEGNIKTTVCMHFISTQHQMWTTLHSAQYCIEQRDANKHASDVCLFVPQWIFLSNDLSYRGLTLRWIMNLIKFAATNKSVAQTVDSDKEQCVHK